MKKVTLKEFFTVVWSGVCQALGWFFGLFGYKREGKFAKCVWGLFAVSAAVVMAVLACVLADAAYDHYFYEHSSNREWKKNGGRFISQTIGYIPECDSKGYIFNKETGKKVLKGIQWISMPLGNDTLCCFSNGSKRGYFNINDGKVVIEPKYEHAWVFSDGLAAVVEHGKVKFIDGTGKVVIDDGRDYDPESCGYVFHDGYLVVMEDDKFGLMDKTGKLVLAKEYEEIEVSANKQYWSVGKDGQWAVLDKDFNVVLPYIDGRAYLGEYIDVTMSDHTMRKYDYDGNLVDDFYVTEVHYLRYETGEISYVMQSDIDSEGEEHEYMSGINEEAIARLMAYSCMSYEGLMTRDGHIVTMPLYRSITAIGPDTYLCLVSDGDNVIVDGKGQIVR